MEQRIKIIIIGLVLVSLACLFLFIQSTNQQKRLLRESNDLKSENTSLLAKVKQLDIDLKGNQGRIDSLKAEKDRLAAELNDLQGKLETTAKARDVLIEKLKEKSRPQPVASAPAPVVQQPAPAPILQNNDAYWGTVLKEKKELETQLADIRVELRNLQIINESLQKEKNKAEVQIQLEAQLSSVRAELRNLQINNESLQREKGILELDLNNLRNEKKDLLRQLDYNQKLVDNMYQEVARERNDKISIQDNFKTVKADNGVLIRQLKSLVSRKIFLDQKVQDLQEAKTALEKRLNETETMLADKSSKIGALKNELDTVKGGKSPEIDTGSNESVELPAIVVRSSPATEKEKAQIQLSSGKILAVNLDSNFVVIDLGSSAGVKVGNVFNVYRGSESIGEISVIQTRTGISACDIKKMSVPLIIGDQVEK